MVSDASFLTSLGRDPSPFQLILDGRVEKPLYCLQTVRTIPGKRQVCLARWQGQDVFAKLYFGLHARRYWQREVTGLQALHARGVLCPTLVHAGSADDGRAFVVLLESIQSAESVYSAWEHAVDDGARFEILHNLAEVFAHMHGTGLEQQDPHLNNFLFAAGQCYTLDGGAIRIFPRALPTGRSLNNLGMLFATIRPKYDPLIVEAFATYCTQRGWTTGKLITRLHRCINGNRRKRRDRYLKKSFRECTAFVCRRELRRYTVYCRRYASPALDAVLTDPEASLQYPGAQLLKAGNTCTVWLAPVGEHRLVIKRYNIKNFLHGLNRAWRRTRAAISWKNAHRLQFYGILTPSPVALVEKRFGPLRGRAYFITEMVDGISCRDFLSDARANGPEENAAVKEITQLLARFADLRISHGDMKASNIILGPAGPTVIDLDALCEHRTVRAFQGHQRRDIRRFRANWRDQPRLGHLFEAALRELGLDDNLG